MEDYFFFGERSEQLFGALHYPYVQNHAANTGILLCQPLAHDYTRAYWAFRKMAILLAKRGHFVIRFDYYGTGDSAGKETDANFKQLGENIALASNELVHASGCKFISIVGLGLGAALAAKYIPTTRKIKRLILWEPVIIGKNYLDRLQNLHEQTVLDPDYSPKIRNNSNENNYKELLGYLYNDKLYKDIETLNLLEVVDWPVEKIELILSEISEIHDLFYRKVAGLNIHIELHKITDAGGWEDFSKLTRALIPSKTIHNIASMI